MTKNDVMVVTKHQTACHRCYLCWLQFENLPLKLRSSLMYGPLCIHTQLSAHEIMKPAETGYGTTYKY